MEVMPHELIVGPRQVVGLGTFPPFVGTWHVGNDVSWNPGGPSATYSAMTIKMTRRPAWFVRWFARTFLDIHWVDESFNRVETLLVKGPH